MSGLLKRWLAPSILGKRLGFPKGTLQRTGGTPRFSWLVGLIFLTSSCSALVFWGCSGDPRSQKFKKINVVSWGDSPFITFLVSPPSPQIVACRDSKPTTFTNYIHNCHERKICWFSGIPLLNLFTSPKQMKLKITSKLSIFFVQGLITPPHIHWQCHLSTSLVFYQNYFQQCHAKMYLGVSKNRGTPKWMVYNGEPY